MYSSFYCFKKLVFTIFLFVPVLFTTTSVQAQAGFSEGAKSLFIGHSFFVPIAKSFDRLANQEGYSANSCQTVFASGPMGLPGALWDNEQKKERVESILSTGDIELFGMTTAIKGDVLQTYQRWIDLALSYNSQTQFFIGHSWIPGGTKMDPEKFSQKIEETGDDLFQTVLELRELYPQTTIYYVNYGITASIMRSMFDAGQLDDISKMAASEGRKERSMGSQERGGLLSRFMNRRNGSESGDSIPGSSGGNREGVKNALFVDPMMGHAGPMMTQMMASVWLHYLYDFDIENLDTKDWNREDVSQILQETLELNDKYQLN